MFLCRGSMGGSIIIACCCICIGRLIIDDCRMPPICWYGKFMPCIAFIGMPIIPMFIGIIGCCIMLPAGYPIGVIPIPFMLGIPCGTAIDGLAWGK